MMSRFQYVARTTAARQVRGIVEAGSKRAAIEELARRQLLIVAIEPAREFGAWLKLGRPVSHRRLVAMYSQLVDLLHSGVPLSRSLAVMTRQCTEPTLKRTLSDMTERLGNGASLSQAMLPHRRTFGDLAINMVKAGEEGGFLEAVLRRIAEFTKRQQRLRSRVTGALAYPVFLLSVTAFVLTVMMTVFVPNFAPIFDRMREGGNLPWLTETLLATSHVIQTNWILCFGGLVTLLGMAVVWGRSDSGQVAIDRFKLWVPGLNGFWRGFAVARFTRIFGTMLAGGVPILIALRISKDSAGNRVLQASIGEAAENLERGDGLAAPLRDSGVFPDDVIEMIAVGEESNNLQNVLIDVADTTEERLSDQIDVLLKLLEPVLLLLLAGITLLIVTALLLPVFSMGELM